MTRREFYLVVAESGVTPSTLRLYLAGKTRAHASTVKAIEDTAKRLGIDTTSSEKTDGVEP